jgi:hypothetical protein
MEFLAVEFAEAIWPPLLDLVAKFTWWLDRIFWPLLLLAQTGLTIWLLCIELSSFLLSRRSLSGFYGFGVHANEDSSGLVAVWVINGFLFVTGYWIWALAYATWSTWVTAKSEKWRPQNTPQAEVMRVDDMLSHRRLWCEECGIRRGDRMSHSWLLGRCLPFFDHECAWWAGVIWAHNVKAYLLFVSFLPVFQFVCLAVSIWTLTNEVYMLKLATWHVAFVALNAFSMVYTAMVARRYLTTFLWYNILEREWGAGRKPVFIFHHGSWTGWQVSDPRDLKTSPWNLELKENWKQIMGSWWTVLAFWTQTPLVKAAKIGQFPFRPDRFSAPPPIPLVPLPEIQRREIDYSRRGATTGSDA